MHHAYYCIHLQTFESTAEEAIPLAVEGVPVPPASESKLLISGRALRMPEQNSRLMADLGVAPMAGDKVTGG